MLGSLSRLLYKGARISRDANAVTRGPGAVGKRIVRKGIGRGLARTGIVRWPR